MTEEKLTVPELGTSITRKERPLGTQVHPRLRAGATSQRHNLMKGSCLHREKVTVAAIFELTLADYGGKLLSGPVVIRH